MATTPYLLLDLPVVSTTVGPTWATKLNAALEQIDTILGPSVVPSRMNINADLEMNGNDLTETRSVRFEDQTSLFSLSADVGSAYFYGGDFYIRNTSGSNVQVTSGGSLASVPTSTNWSQQAYSASQTISTGATYNQVLADTTIGDLTFTLNAASGYGTGRWIVFSKTTSDLNTITFAPNGTDTINGVNASYTVRGSFVQCMLVRISSTAWHVMGLDTNENVYGARVNNAPGSLTIGNTLQVIGTAQLTYQALNLAGGANYVSGILPQANLPDATDAVTGIIQLSTDLGGSAASPEVIGITGDGGEAAIRCETLAFEDGVGGPTITYATTTAACGQLNIIGQTTSGPNDGGAVAVFGGPKGAAGNHGHVYLGTGEFDPTMHLASIGSDRIVTGFVSGGTTVGTTEVPGGSGVLFVQNAITAPSTNPVSEVPVGGLVMYSDSGAFTIKAATGQTTKLGSINTISGSLTTNGSQTLIGTANTATAYMNITINGTTYKIPLYT